MTLSLANATTKRASYELPPISRVQEMGGSSYAGDYDSAACLRWLLGLAHKIAQLSYVLC